MSSALAKELKPGALLEFLEDELAFVLSVYDVGVDDNDNRIVHTHFLMSRHLDILLLAATIDSDGKILGYEEVIE